jgi:hypothetical protein
MLVGEKLTASRQHPCFVGTPDLNVADEAGGAAFVRGAVNALKAYEQRCSAQSSDRRWLAAELALLGMVRQEGAHHGCDRLWSASASAHCGHGFKSIMLPITSALVRTPVFATCGLEETQVGGRRLDVPILVIDAGAPPGEPVASREEMVKAFELYSHTWPAHGCLHKVMAIMSAWTNRRLFAGFTADVATGSVDLKIIYSLDFSHLKHDCRVTCDGLDITLPKSKGSKWVTFHTNKSMARNLKIKIIDPVKGGEAIFRHHSSLASSPKLDLKCLSGPDALELPVPAVDDDVEAESPFSAENMRLVFLGKRKPKLCDFG